MNIFLTDSPNAINVQECHDSELILIKFKEDDKYGTIRVAWYSTYEKDYIEYVLDRDGIVERINRK